MTKIDIRKYLSDQVMDELDSLTMDVSRSFLNGYKSSPIDVQADSGMMSRIVNSALAVTPDNTQKTLAYLQNSTSYGYDIYQKSMVNLNSINKSLTNAGIYINKDGKRINISTDFNAKVADITSAITSSAFNAVTNVTKTILSDATSKILKFPDPHYFTSYVTTYFSKWVKSEECQKEMAELLAPSGVTLNSDTDDKKDSDDERKEIEEKKKSKFLDKITYFCYAKVPVIGNWINEKSKLITEGAAWVSSYAAMNSDWVIDHINDYIDEGVQEVRDWVDDQVEWVENQKQTMYETIAKSMTEEAIKQHKKLLERAKRLISKETKTKIEMAELKAKMAIIDAAAKVCAKFGVPVPSFDDIIKQKELLKKAELIKKGAELVEQMTKGDSGDITDQTDESEEITYTVEEILEMTNEEILSHGISELYQMRKILLDELADRNKSAGEIEARIKENNDKIKEIWDKLELMDETDTDDTDDIDNYYNLHMQLTDLYGKQSDLEVEQEVFYSSIVEDINEKIKVIESNKELMDLIANGYQGGLTIKKKSIPATREKQQRNIPGLSTGSSEESSGLSGLSNMSDPNIPGLSNIKRTRIKI